MYYSSIVYVLTYMYYTGVTLTTPPTYITSTSITSSIANYNQPHTVSIDYYSRYCLRFYYSRYWV